MELTNFLAIPIVGIALSLGIQWAKNKFNFSAFGAKATTVIASLVLGVIYYFLQNTAVWVTITGILGTATTFWAWFLKQDSE